MTTRWHHTEKRLGLLVAVLLGVLAVWGGTSRADCVVSGGGHDCTCSALQCFLYRRTPPECEGQLAPGGSDVVEVTFPAPVAKIAWDRQFRGAHEGQYYTGNEGWGWEWGEYWDDGQEEWVWGWHKTYTGHSWVTTMNAGGVMRRYCKSRYPPPYTAWDERESGQYEDGRPRWYGEAGTKPDSSYTHVKVAVRTREKSGGGNEMYIFAWGANYMRFEQVFGEQDSPWEPVTDADGYWYNPDDTLYATVSYSDGIPVSAVKQGAAITYDEQAAGTEGVSTKTVKEDRDGTVVRYEFTRSKEVNGSVTRTRVTEVTFNSDHDPGTTESKRLLSTIYVYYPGNAEDPKNRYRLHFVVEPEGVRRYLKDNSSKNGVDPTITEGSPPTYGPLSECDLDDSTEVSDDDLDDYASVVYNSYDWAGRVMSKTVGSACGSCGGGEQGTHTYTYVYNDDYPEEPTDDQKHNSWQRCIRTTRPTGLREVDFMNYYGRPIYHIVQAMNGSTIDAWWLTHTIYYKDADGDYRAGLQKEVRYPSAGTHYTLSTSSGWVTGVTDVPEQGSGVVRYYDYHDPSGQLFWEKVTGNIGGEGHYVRKYTYGTDAASGYTDYNDYEVYRLATETTYPSYDTDDNSSDRRVTTYTYTYHQDGGSNTHEVKTKKVSHPKVSTSNNGSGDGPSDPVAEVEYFYSQLDDTDNCYHNWTKHEDGSLSYTRISEDGNVEREIQDVDTDETGDFEELPSGWSNSAGLHLKTIYTYDDYGRLETVEYPGGRKTKYAYMCMSTTDTNPTEETTTHLVTLQTPYVDAGGTNYNYAPMTITVTNLAGEPVTDAAGIPDTATDGNLANDWDKSKTSVDEAFDCDGSGKLTYRTEYSYNGSGQLQYVDRYHDIPASGAGSEGTNYYRTEYAYDSYGRRWKTEEASGTITITQVDAIGRQKATWRGTNAAGGYADDPDGTGSPNNMVQVTALHYDDAADGTILSGGGNLTREVSYVDGSTTLTTLHKYDYRNRRQHTRGPDDVATKFTYDATDTVTAVETYADSDTDFVIDSGELRAKNETKYDARGQVYQTISYEVAGGTAGDRLTTNYWYDAAGREIKTADPNGLFTKTSYDGAGRTVANYTCYDTDETAYDDADDVTGDTVIEQDLTYYDSAGNVWLSAALRRTHTASGTGGLSVGSEPKGRPTYTAMWYDVMGRLTKTVFYGTNDDNVLAEQTDDFNPEKANVQAYTATGEGDIPEPNTSDKYIVTKIEYNDAGMSYRTYDNRNKETRKSFDDLGRTTEIVENYYDGTAAAADVDKDRITEPKAG